MPPAEDIIKQLQDENAALKEQFRRAQPLISLGELAGTTTHEFNNILMTILNYSKIALRTPDTALRDKYLNQILVAAERAAKVTSSVLGMARNRSTGMEPTDIRQLLEDILLLLEREMNKYRVSVERNYEENLPRVLINGNQVQQVILNLLINARQAMPEGGRLLLRLNYDKEANMVDVVIRDFGCGMPQDVLRRIFEPFFSTKKGPDESGKGGTGLGLSLCKEIIENHKGRIRVQSSVGVGTEFTIKLPVVPATREKANVVKETQAGAVPTAQTKPVRKKTVRKKKT